MAAMLRAGHTGMLLAGNPVEHHIHPSRQNLDYIRSYYFAQGWQAGKRLIATASGQPAFAKAMARTVAAICGSLAPTCPGTTARLWLERQSSHFGGRYTALSDAG